MHSISVQLAFSLNLNEDFSKFRLSLNRSDSEVYMYEIHWKVFVKSTLLFNRGDSSGVLSESLVRAEHGRSTRNNWWSWKWFLWSPENKHHFNWKTCVKRITLNLCTSFSFSFQFSLSLCKLELFCKHYVCQGCLRFYLRLYDSNWLVMSSV